MGKMVKVKGTIMDAVIDLPAMYRVMVMMIKDDERPASQEAEDGQQYADVPSPMLNCPEV